MSILCDIKYLSNTARKPFENIERLGIFYKFIFWRCYIMLMTLKLISIMKFNTSCFAVHLQKTLYFLVFHQNIGLKTSKHEFNDRRNQNKQGFEGTKLSRKEFVAFEEYQRVCVDDIASSAKILTVFLPRFSRLFCFLSSRILQNNFLHLYLVKIRGYKLSFFVKPATKSLPHFSVFKKSWREANNRPVAGTSHMIGHCKFIQLPVGK